MFRFLLKAAFFLLVASWLVPDWMRLQTDDLDGIVATETAMPAARAGALAGNDPCADDLPACLARHVEALPSLMTGAIATVAANGLSGDRKWVAELPLPEAAKSLLSPAARTSGRVSASGATPQG